jgi:hypothetical protein
MEVFLINAKPERMREPAIRLTQAALFRLA